MTNSPKRNDCLIFISYRRADSAHVADRIHSQLVQEFGAESVFKDVDAIPVGVDFRTCIRDAIGKCDALIAIVGPRWATVTDQSGKRRLADPKDLVRNEIESAIELGIPPIPLFVDCASVDEDQLPESLKEFAFCHGLPIRPDPDFAADITRLVKELKGFFEASSVRRQQDRQEDTIVYPNENRYVGELKDGRPHGQGTMFYAGGSKYTGEWQDGRKHGWGMLSGKSGKYAGEWRNGEKIGQWSVTYANGSKYAGEWRNRSFHGVGMMAYENGDKYVGQWKGGRKHGYGTYVWTDGRQYTGAWRRNKFHGEGTLIYADGSKYMGQWKDGIMHGSGTLFNSDGTVDRSGTWLEGKCAGG